MTKKWIKKAIRNPGALRRLAQSEGAITPQGTISMEWLREKAKGSGIVAKRANLAMTLRELRKKRRRKNR